MFGVNYSFRSLEQVRRTKEPLFNSLMTQHHYLGYKQPVGEHLKYVVWSHHRPAACLAWSSAPRHLASRDHYIGWDCRSAAQPYPLHRLQHPLPDPAVGAREHLASHILGRMAARISDDWQQLYGHPIYFLKTLIKHLLLLALGTWPAPPVPPASETPASKSHLEAVGLQSSLHYPPRRPSFRLRPSSSARSL